MKLIQMRGFWWRPARVLTTAVLLLAFGRSAADDAIPTTPEVAAQPSAGPAPSPSALRVGGQFTATGFAVPGMRSPYRNPLVSFGERVPTTGWSFVVTAFLGVLPWKGAVLVAQPEFADGAGAPNVSGLAGYIDGNIIRVAKVGTAPYVARVFLQQDFALGPLEPVEDGSPEDEFMPTATLARERPRSRLELTAGKIALTDFFDVASASSDPRHKFLNWSLMTNAAWDYAADTRGYTWGLLFGIENPGWAVRVGEAMMPTAPNGPVLDGDLAQARSDVLEIQLRHRTFGNAGALKLLGYANHARMGAFSDALAQAPADQAPVIGSVAKRGAAKYGLGLLVDQAVGSGATFLRASLNDGRTEEFAFTQVERAVSAGAEIPAGALCGLEERVGIGAAVNGLSPSHVRYLRAGGVDFQLGDGSLRYRPEMVAELYYALRLGRLFELSADVQAIVNPGMNADRGPAMAVGLRLHAHA